MKKIWATAAVLAVLGFTAPAYAQSTADEVKKDVKDEGKEIKQESKKAGKKVKKATQKVGDEAGKIAAKGLAHVTDKVSDEWVGPDGQTIYVDDVNKYYWINDKGEKMFVSREELKPKQKD